MHPARHRQTLGRRTCSWSHALLKALDHTSRAQRNLRHFDYVMARFGITAEKLGATAHGLRHEAMIDHYTDRAGAAPPVRGGSDVPPDVDAAARLSVAHLAGHNRVRASGAYLGELSARQTALLAQQRGNAPDASGDESLPEAH